jgi:hypothetical protein
MAAENEAPDDFISEEEFREAMKDPKFAAGFLENMRQVVRGDFGEVPPEMVASARHAITLHETQQKVIACGDKLKEFMALMHRPAGTMRAEDRLAEAQRLCDEYMDLGLELPEPHRTEFLKDFVQVREYVKSLRVPE